MLSDWLTVFQAIAGDELSICVTNGFDGAGITQFVIEIFQKDVEPMEDIVNAQILSKHVLRSDMGDPSSMQGTDFASLMPETASQFF